MYNRLVYSTSFDTANDRSVVMAATLSSAPTPRAIAPEPERASYIRWFNTGLACIHLTSTFGIWAYGQSVLKDRSKATFVVDIAPWISLNNTGTCTETDFAKDSLGEKVGLKVYSADLLDFCIAFTVISAMYHIFVAVLQSRVLLIEAWFNPFRWVDYGLSTPFMGIVLYASYGVDDFHTILAQAAGFSAMQCIGATIELLNATIVSIKWDASDSRRVFKYGLYRTSAKILFVVGFGILGALFTPLFRNMQLLRKLDEAGTDNRVTTSPPAAVIAFTWVLLGFYSLFGAVSIYSYLLAEHISQSPAKAPSPEQPVRCSWVPRLYPPRSLSRSDAELFAQYRIDKLYGSCSAMAKTVLHWALALVVLGQDEMVSDTRFDDPHIRCAAETSQVESTQVALIAVTCLGLALGLIVISMPSPVTVSLAPFSGAKTADTESNQRLMESYM